MHNVKYVELLKHIKIIEAVPKCFDLQRNHHQGDTASAYIKLQDWFSVDIDIVQTLSVLWRHSMTCVACVWCTVQVYMLAQCVTHATQVILCRHSTDVYINTEPILVILAKHWLWLPDDGFFVN